MSYWNTHLGEAGDSLLLVSSDQNQGPFWRSWHHRAGFLGTCLLLLQRSDWLGFLLFLMSLTEWEISPSGKSYGVERMGRGKAAALLNLAFLLGFFLMQGSSKSL